MRFEMEEENYDLYIKDNTTNYHYMERETDLESLCGLLNDFDNLTKELYEFRLVYNALLFNEWYKHDVFEVYKSKKHDNGELCFEDDENDWFIVVAILPSGQITNHYNMKDWELFKIPEYDKVKDKFDGHTSKDVLNRLRGVLK